MQSCMMQGEPVTQGQGSLHPWESNLLAISLCWLPPSLHWASLDFSHPPFRASLTYEFAIKSGVRWRRKKNGEIHT